MDKLQRFGLMSRFGERAFFATIEEAVGAFLADSPSPGDPVHAARSWEAGG